jgi:hypothetical protein
LLRNYRKYEGKSNEIHSLRVRVLGLGT